jgi:hypothetical protein
MGNASLKVNSMSRVSNPTYTLSLKTYVVLSTFCGALFLMGMMGTSYAQSFVHNINDAKVDFINTKSETFPTPSPSFFSGARWALDVGSQTRSRLDAERLTLINFMGLDFYSELQTPYRNWGSIVAQFYVLRFDMLSDPDPSKTGSRYRFFPCVIAPNITLLPQGALALKFGHIWPVYGLRDSVNTTHTLRQLINVTNVGLTVDWGVELHGERGGFVYGMSLTRGTGNGWSSQGDPYIFSGRIGSSEGTLPFKFGFSGLAARLMTAGGIEPRWRAGFDLQLEGPLNLLLEGSIGEDFGQESVFNLIAEVNWKSPMESVMIYAQQRQIRTPTTNSTPVTLGVLGVPIPNLYLGVEFIYETNSPSPTSFSQIRYRW